uniref:hypothetical protein n=1 Tax=uncultured Mobiluncus sp. TaxID=293425 RepID=UPI00261E5CEE
MSVARPDSPDDTNDLLGKPLTSGFAGSDTGWNSAAAGEHNATFDSVIAGSAESAGDSYETAQDSDPTDY